MSITGGSLTRMKTMKTGSLTRIKTTSMIAMRTALVLSCLFLASRSARSIGSQSAGSPPAPRPCVVLQTDPAQGAQPPEGRLRRGSIVVTQGCTLTVWTGVGGHQTSLRGTQVHLKGREWTSQPLAIHCSCNNKMVERQCENFMKRHLDEYPQVDSDNYCNKMMRNVNKGKECKPINTFIHAAEEKVVQVCKTKVIDKKNNHCSTQPFKLTECFWNKKRPCKYKAKDVRKRIIIACLRGKPVHFNGSRNEYHSIIL